MNKLNAVKMVREIRDRIAKELESKTEAEIKEYYKIHSEWAFKTLKNKQKQEVK